MASPDPADAERPITIADLERLPEEDAYRVELVRGKLVRSPRPGAVHGRLTVRLVRTLDQHAEELGAGVVLADAGVVLERNPDTVRGPDLSYYSPQRVPRAGYADTFWGPPDLAVEIVSTPGRRSAAREKLADYLARGVRRVWIVDVPAGTVTVHRPDGEPRVLGGGDVLEGEDVLPGLRLPLAALFAL